jgi:hypothetical protein
VCSALLAACSSPPERPAPKFSGRLLFLNGSGPNGSDLVELTAAPDGSTHNLTNLTNGVFAATASADQTQLLYATKDEIMLRDLGSSATKSVLKGQSYCLTWAPDGKRFSYLQTSPDAKSAKLYVSDLEGKTKLIWEDTSGLETAPSRCAQWIGPDRIVFDRFSGMILKGAVGQSLKPNTSTIATVTESVKFTDSPRKLSVRAACPAGTVFLTPADEPNPMQIATRVDRLDKLSTVPGPSEGVFIGFAARSCVPFFISQSLSSTTDLFSLNPTNWQRLRTASIQQTFSPNARFVIKSSARLMIAGDAPDKLFLIDTESGDIVKLAPAAGTIQSPVPIVWIEN